MNDWFDEIGVGCELPAGAARALLDAGFVVIPDFVATERLAQLADAYDLAVASAAAPDLHIGSSTTRVHDFVNRGADFDPLYVCPPHSRSVPSRHRPALQAQFNAGEDIAATFTGTAPPRGLCIRSGWVADGWVHRHGGRLSQR
jgi:hypothetical protein